MFTNRLLSFFLLLVLAGGPFAKGAERSGLISWQSPDSLYFFEHYQVQKVMIPMRDGVKLYTEIFVPKDASKAKTYPFLMTRTPYNATRAQHRLFSYPSFAKLMREGFIIVEQDVRGRWRSEGDFSHERPEVANPDKKKQKQPDESTDTYDTIDWLLKNVPGNNGKVGVHGVSYPGFY